MKKLFAVILLLALLIPSALADPGGLRQRGLRRLYR